MVNRRRLLVEGKDDLNVIAHLLRAHGFEDKIRIVDQEGLPNVLGKLNFENLMEAIPVEVKGSDLGCLGIVVDADGNLCRRWEAVSNKLRSLNYLDIPDRPNPNGTILEHPSGLPRFGVWIMPDNLSDGLLENFVQALIPAESQGLFELAVSAVGTIPHEERRFVNADIDHTAKAEIHTYLAWQSRPGVPFGIAIRERFLDAKTDVASRLIDWLVGLFNLN